MIVRKCEQILSYRGGNQCAQVIIPTGHTPPNLTPTPRRSYRHNLPCATCQYMPSRDDLIGGWVGAREGLQDHPTFTKLENMSQMLQEIKRRRLAKITRTVEQSEGVVEYVNSVLHRCRSVFFVFSFFLGPASKCFLYLHTQRWKGNKWG